MPYFILLYRTVPGYVERRSPYRKAHFDYLSAYVERGELLLAGAYAEPADGAVLVFKTDSRSSVEKFALNDPYVTNGLIERWECKKWQVVLGSLMDN